MNEKLNIQDLTEELAENHGLSKKNAESFVKDFFTLIEDALEKDKYVKIKGLGTFKLIDVDSRESINVNTGERFEIQGHSKISFTPDSALKEVVNKPFSAFETVVLSEDAAINEPVVDEKTGETGNTAFVEPITEEPVTEEPVAEEEPIAEEPVAEEEPITEEPVAEEPVVEEPVVAAPIEGEKSDVEILPIFDDEEIKKRDVPVSHHEEVKALKLSDEKRKEISKKAEGSSTPYMMFIAVLIIMLCLGAVAYLYYPDLVDKNAVQPTTIEEPIEDNFDGIPLTTGENDEINVVPEAENNETEEPATENVETQNPIVQETASLEVQKLEEGVLYTTDGDLATHTVERGETLNAIARKYYGTGKLYNYIVSYNKTIIKDPDNVPVGTAIKIPKLVKK
ncbi:MAG: HU family DNA-binding protein [Bacteroidaceae bacterium]|nr:HU family DNA-binding protein [Bacteroidaceae bacterium]